MKKFLSVLLAALIACAAAGCGASSSGTQSGASGESSASGGTFTVGMECDYAPYNWTQASASDRTVPISSGGYADGYDVQIAKLIAEGLGKELVIEKIEWGGLTPALQSGKIDAIIAGMSPTEDRKLTIDFTDNYYMSQLVIVVKKDGPYANAKTLADFDGASIVAQQGTFHDSVVDQIPNVNHAVPLGSFPEMIVALRSGAVDGYISERPGALSAQASNGDLVFVEFAEGQGFTYSPDDAAIAAGIAKGNDALREQINTILAGITQEQRDQIMMDALANQPAAAQ